MAVEGFDAGLAIETAGFVPQVAVAEGLEPEAEATLEEALAAAAAPDAGAGSERLRDEVTLDLWVEEGSRAMAPVLHIGGPFDVTGAQLADDPLILHKLTIDDLDRASSTGRYGDSTEDYGWYEMSTGDWEWAVMGMADSAKNDITAIVRNSTSIEEAQQRIHQYLVDHGLSNVVQVYNPATWGPDGAIVVTGHPPPPPPPPFIGNFDPFGGSYTQNSGNTPANTIPVSTEPIPDNNPDGPDVGIDVTNEANRQHVLEWAEKLKAGIELLDGKFATLSDGARFMMKDGTVVTGAEVKAWWQQFDFRVTDRAFLPGMGGAVVGRVSNINWATVATYSIWDINGLSFIILHEFMHATAFGERIRDAAFAMHVLFGGRDQDYDPSDYWWDVNEEATNWAARELMEGFEISPPTHLPTYGYDDTMPASPLTLPPPPPPYFGDGEGGGNVDEN